MPAPDDSSANIIQQLMEGHNQEENFRRLFERYYRAVSGFFFRKGFSAEDSRDLTQEVFVAVFRGIKDLRTEGAFISWLFSIANHVALRYWEQERSRPRVLVAKANESDSDDQADDAIAAAPTPGLDPENKLLDTERVYVVRKALEELPERMQHCLRARLLEGLGNREISLRLGISESTVAVHVHRGIQELRSRLCRYFGKLTPYANKLFHPAVRPGKHFVVLFVW